MDLLDQFKKEKEQFPLSSSFVVYHKVIRHRGLPPKVIRSGFLRVVDKHDYELRDLERLVAWLLIETNK